tara:strand:+ start:8681 stop:8833 length:153 start_codon:yes stop_codon:yes gene_type:complete
MKFKKNRFLNDKQLKLSIKRSDNNLIWSFSNKNRKKTPRDKEIKKGYSKE